VGLQQVREVLAEALAEHPHRADDDAVLEGRLCAGRDGRPRVELVSGALEAAVHGPHHHYGVHVLVHVQLRREADLEVAHPLGLIVDRQLIRCTLKGDLALHHADRVAEAAQVLRQVRVAVLEHERPQPVLGVARQLDVVLAGQVDERADAH
jgi:hypothetical protein